MLQIENEPLVSIIVLAYNSEEFLLRTLESVRHQTYNNIELIVADDGSTDRSVQIAKEWIATNTYQFKNAKVIEGKINRGLPFNNNQGYRASNGSWLKFLDADDCLKKGAIEIYVKHIQSHPHVKFLCTDAQTIDEKDININENVYKGENTNWKKYFLTKPVQWQLKQYKREPIFLTPSTFFISREVIDVINGFDENLKIFQDIPLIFRVLNNGYKIEYLDEKIIYYRIHKNSVSKTKNKKVSQQGLKDKKFIFENYHKPILKKTNLLDAYFLLNNWFLFTWSLKYKFKGHFIIKLLNPYKVYKSVLLWFHKIK